MRTLWTLLRYPGSVLYYPPAPASWVPVLRDLIILSFARPFASKTVFHFHAHGLGRFLEDKKWLAKWSWAWSKPDFAVVLGQSCVDDAGLLMPRNLSVVPYGIDIVPAVRRRPDSAKTIVLYVGMLAEEKGLFDLLETASQVRDQNIEFRLVGTYKHSETQPRFEASRSELELEDSVIAVGRRSGQELWQEYADADIFFFPTHFETETFGIVLLEAMAHRLPVVASRWRGPIDIIRDGETGILCPPNDPRSFADAIGRLSSDPELRSRMGNAGLTTFKTDFTLDKFLASIEKVFLRAGCAVKDC